MEKEWSLHYRIGVVNLLRLMMEKNETNKRKGEEGVANNEILSWFIFMVDKY